MASSQNMKIVGIALVVVGIALLVWGFQMSDSFGNQMAETFTGASMDEVMYRYIGGAVCLVVGGYLFLKK